MSARPQEHSSNTRALKDSGMATVASVGTIKISVNEFLANYQFGPAFFKRQKDARDRYLNTMIYEKLLAMEGYEKELHQDASVKRAVKAYEDDILTEELYKEKIMNRITITDEEIEKWLPLARKVVELAWIYATHKDSILTIWSKLNQGFSFDSLFKSQLTDSLEEESRLLKSKL